MLHNSLSDMKTHLRTTKVINSSSKDTYWLAGCLLPGTASTGAERRVILLIHFWNSVSTLSVLEVECRLMKWWIFDINSSFLFLFQQMAATQPNFKRDRRHRPQSDTRQEAAEDSRDGVNYGLAARNSATIEMFYAPLPRLILRHSISKLFSYFQTTLWLWIENNGCGW